MIQYEADMPAKNVPLISWSVEEYPHKEKNSDWFWALGVIAVAIAVISIIYHNILFAVVIILGATILGYYASRNPEIIDISFSEEGILVKELFYPYEKISGFAIERHTHNNCLLIETGRTVMPVIAIPIPDTDLDLDMLNDFMKERVEPKPLKDSTFHRIMEHIGF